MHQHKRPGKGQPGKVNSVWSSDFSGNVREFDSRYKNDNHYGVPVTPYTDHGLPVRAAFSTRAREERLERAQRRVMTKVIRHGEYLIAFI